MGCTSRYFLESFIKNHKVLLNCAYQQGLLVQKEKNYKQAIVHYAYGLYYLMNFYKADFRPMAHIIDYVSTETELVEMAQEKFINKIQRCVKYANLEATEIKTIASKLILGSPLPYLEFEDFFITIEPYLFKKDTSYPNQSSGDLQSKPLEEWSWAYNGNDELMNGLIFQATLQLRTPLEILKHHNEIFNNKHKAPPKYAKEGWEGMWLPNLKTWREMGIDEDELPNHTVSTDIGSLEDDEAEKYYKFLLEFHTIVENNHLNVKDKINHLETLYRDNPHYNNFLDSNSFESYFGLLISNVFSPKVALTLKNEGFRTLEDLKGADLEYLGTLNGIGKATLEKLKPYVNAH
ncbi:MAG: helix-hairpin-helix domain-containing protein [Sulfurospirillum cavolei]|nr:helix-hairpin-helix domain-containing protein [Sulfurospirillum cavolei]